MKPMALKRRAPPQKDAALRRNEDSLEPEAVESAVAVYVLLVVAP